jgi:hypothetical protein
MSCKQTQSSYIEAPFVPMGCGPSLQAIAGEFCCPYCFSTIGSGGDVQPVLALASHLKAVGHERVCVPPDLRESVGSLGIPLTPIGPGVRSFVRPVRRPRSRQTPLTAAQRRQMMEATVATQFETLTSATQECDVIVAATALQVAARSVGRSWGFLTYSPPMRRCCCRRRIMHHCPCRPYPAGSTRDERQQWALGTECGTEKRFSS